MDKHCSGSDSDSSGEYVYDNPFLLEDDKFEREFETTLALFDALLIGEDSLSDTFSLSSSPSSTLKFDSKKFETKPRSYANDHSKPTATLPKKQNLPVETDAEERPKSFLHDEVSEFNRLLKELSETPLTNKRSSSTLGPHSGSKSRNSGHHHHSFSVSLPHQKHLDEGTPATFEPQVGADEFEPAFPNAEERLLSNGLQPCECGYAPRSGDRPGQSNEDLFPISSCSNCIKRQSLRRILESDFFESLKTSRSYRSCDALSPSRPVEEDRGGYSLGRRLPSHGLPHRFTSLDCGLEGKKDESDSAYQTGSTDTLKSTSASSLSLVPGTMDFGEDCPSSDRSLPERPGLEEKLLMFNRNKSGLFVELVDGMKNICHGTIRVHLNLIQPISMRLGPAHLHPSSLTGVRDDDDDDDRNRKGSVKSSSTSSMRTDEMASLSTTTSLSSSSSVHHSLPELGNRYASFYVPPDVTKVIHVTSESTTPTVIKTLLNKFQIVNSAKRFALFQRTYDRPVDANHGETEFKDGGSDLHLARPLTCHMRKLRDDERPLEILLRAVEETGVEALEMIHFVLQEYSSGEIIWDAFSVPELNNFLTILSREEQLKIDEVMHRYEDAKATIRSKIQELETKRNH